MRAGFLRRESCPLCRSAEQRELCDLDYDTPVLSAFLERFYGSRIGPSQLAAGRFRVVACSQCNFIYQDPILDDSGMRKLYNDWVDQAASLNKKQQAGAGLYRQYAGQMQTLSQLFEQASYQVSVLDFGMGWGYWCRMAQAHGFAVSGLELASNRRDHARQWGLTVTETLDPDAGGFDFIYTNQVFEHLPDPSATLRELCQYLNRDGILHIRVPDGRGVDRQLQRHGWSPAIDAVHPLEHINCFTRANLIRFAATAGLRPFNPPLRLQWDSLAAGIRREISDRWFSTQLMFRR
jgi:SAM-dependent methyltransferase